MDDKSGPGRGGGDVRKDDAAEYWSWIEDPTLNIIGDEGVLVSLGGDRYDLTAAAWATLPVGLGLIDIVWQAKMPPCDVDTKRGLRRLLAKVIIEIVTLGHGPEALGGTFTFDGFDQIVEDREAFVLSCFAGGSAVPAMAAVPE